MHRFAWQGVGIALAFTALMTGEIPAASAKTEIPAGAVVEVDQQTVQDILGTFQRAEEAIYARNLDAVMTLYAGQYNYHGLKKADIQKIWSDFFEEYRDITGTHLFTKIAKVGSGTNAIIEVTCTGSLSGLSKTSGLRVPIDSWYEEVHYLTLEGGVWRIRGNAGDTPRALPFGTAPHPLF
jgi:hypothetical protein